MDSGPSVFARLMAVIEDRKANPPAKSYTTELFAGGVDANREKRFGAAGLGGWGSPNGPAK